ncbi:MAG TPA: zinc-binding alcohol dehydrogenase family protein [Bryobacteraceae bacterium]|nr:zinc-binding alcohol dehydrogenase family protein [Bryobacteraceae bacterium]
MRQIVLEQPGIFQERFAPPAAASAGEALVRVHRVGVCGTDLHAFAGRQPFFTYPRILGHELGVEVLEAPANDRGIKAGSRCAVEPYISCGRCHACGLGRPNCCETLRVLGVHCEGGMRPFISVPVQLLHVSDRLSLDQLALVETLGIGAHAVQRSGLRAGEQALVVGAGPIGLAVVQFAQAAGGVVRMLEISEPRRAFVERLGVETMEKFDGRPADVVFDATGSPPAMEASFDYPAHGGRLVFVGLAQARISFDDPQFHRRELTVFASRNSCHDFPGIIRMIEEGKIDTAPWITIRMGLSEVPARFPLLRQQPNLVKAMIDVQDTDT